MRKTKMEEYRLGGASSIQDCVSFNCLERQQIEDIFLYFSRIMYEPFREEIQAVSCKWLSCDHTFKISKLVKTCDVTPTQGKDTRIEDEKKMPKTDQFSACLFCLNEMGQIASFCLTRSTSYSECSDVVNDVCHRNMPQLIITGLSFSFYL